MKLAWFAVFFSRVARIKPGRRVRKALPVRQVRLAQSVKPGLRARRGQLVR